MLSLVSDKRRLSLFSSLKTRKSQYFTEPAKPISRPRPLSLLISHNINKRHSVISSVLDDKENMKLKRNLAVYNGKIQSPSSERTLATLSPVASDIGSLDTVSLDGISPSSSSYDKLGDPTMDYPDYLSYLSVEEAAQKADATLQPQEMEVHRLHRTTRLCAISEFMTSDSVLPLGNRKSLEFEANEIQQLHAAMFQENEGDLTMRLVENTLFMSFYKASEDAATQRNVRYWDDIDVDEIFHDDDDSIEQGYYL